MVDFVILNGLAIEGAAQSSTGSSRDRRTTIMETLDFSEQISKPNPVFWPNNAIYQGVVGLPRNC
jgi:hypothetical protein